MKNISVGTEALDDPFVNQGTAFSQDARIKRKLRGLLPPRAGSGENSPGRRTASEIRNPFADPPQERNSLLLPPRK